MNKIFFLDKEDTFTLKRLLIPASSILLVTSLIYWGNLASCHGILQGFIVSFSPYNIIKSLDLKDVFNSPHYMGAGQSNPSGTATAGGGKGDPNKGPGGDRPNGFPSYKLLYDNIPPFTGGIFSPRKGVSRLSLNFQGLSVN